MSSVAVGIVIVSLCIFGFFLLLVVNLGNLVGSLGTRMDIVAYVQKDIENKEAQEIKQKLEHIQGVAEVQFVHKEDAWEQFKKEQGNNLNLSEVVESNPLPNSFVIKATSAENVPSVSEKISKLQEIDEVRYSGTLIKQISSLVEVVRIGGFLLVILLSFATLLIVVNTIRLTVLARETDITIMRLVGATDSFIRWPFIIEGLLMGIIGGLVSIGILKFSYDMMINRLQVALPFVPIIKVSFVLSIIYLMVLVLGTILGMLGGYISVSKILKE